jgi:hypothetical protein
LDTRKIIAKSREGPTGGWIVLAVHPSAVARDALGRVAVEFSRDWVSSGVDRPSDGTAILSTLLA